MRLVRLIPALAMAASLLVAPASRADGLSADESARLLHGDPIRRTQTLDRAGRHYVGGVTYAIVDASPAELSALLDDVQSWRRFLPRTRDAQLVGEAAGDALVEMTHGSSLVQVRYTLRMRREASLVRFWMDRERPHDIGDVWGYLRATPMADGRTLLAWGILVDMGPGLLRDLFEDRVQALALGVPERVRDVLVQRSARGARASR